MATITAGEFRNGKTFEMDGKVMQVVEFQHVKPGKGAAFVRTKMKNVVTGAVTETSFNPTAKFEEAFVERKDMEYSYNDGDLYYFMDQETYDAFLDDLQSMGAVSEIEKRQMGYQGFQLIAYMDEDGNWVKCGSPSGVWSIPEGAIKNDECMFAPWGEETDISKWLADRTQNELVGVFDPSDWDQGRTYESLLKGVLKIVNRMEARQEEDAEAAEKAGLRRQIMDSESDFYTSMLNKMQAQVEKTRDDKEQQAIVDALGEVLDALSGKKDVTGEKASVNKTASDLTAKMGERIARLKQEDPEHPEAVKLEQMLKRLQELGIYFDLSDTDDIFTEEEDSFETLTQLLTRRQREEAISDTPQTERGEQQQ